MQYCSKSALPYRAVMTMTVQLSQRGTFTLPKRLRERFGLAADATLVLEETAEGILLRPAAVFPIEMYSEARIAGFEAANDEALADLFPPEGTAPAGK
jgi:bifunctional DNA-binding transcriptional regulator/antitoxin component of YhaV-PrlF toxin-antitoxin module